jgi:hypothetical protein
LSVRFCNFSSNLYMRVARLYWSDSPYDGCNECALLLQDVWGNLQGWNHGVKRMVPLRVKAGKPSALSKT